MNVTDLKKRLARVADRSLMVNTGWMLLGQGSQLVLQAIYFVIVARVLGAEQYGAFVSVVALVGILTPFAGLGMGSILIKNASRDRSLFSAYWGNALFAICVTGFGLLVLILALRPFILPASISIWVLVLVATADLILTRIVDTASKAFQAVERLRGTSLISTLLFIVRAGAALVMLQLFPTPSATIWALLYFGSTLVTALVALVLVSSQLGRPHLALNRMRPELGEGFFFAVSQSGQNVNNNIDKVMLSNLSTLEATGIYAAAYRLIAVAMAPMRSLLYAAYARFFKQGESGISGSLSVARRLLPLAGVYGLLAMLALIVLAPVVPIVLGAEYVAAVSALRWLAPLPLLKGLHFMASDTLSGSGYQRTRSIMIALAALLNVGLNLWLIPTYSWLGAAWSSLASDGFLALSLWTLVLFYNWRSLRVPRMLGQQTSQVNVGNEL